MSLASPLLAQGIASGASDVQAATGITFSAGTTFVSVAVIVTFSDGTTQPSTIQLPVQA